MHTQALMPTLVGQLTYEREGDCFDIYYEREGEYYAVGGVGRLGDVWQVGRLYSAHGSPSLGSAEFDGFNHALNVIDFEIEHDRQERGR